MVLPDALATTLANDFNNIVAHRAEVDALTAYRLASVVDLQQSQSYADLLKIQADDTGVIYTATIPQVSVTGKYYEIFNTDVLKNVLGQKKVSIAASPVTVTNEAKGTGWVQGKPIKLTNKNGNNTIIDLTGTGAVKAGGSNLTRGTDFRDYVGDGVNGLEGETYIVPITSQTLAITATYQYTPNAGEYAGNVVDVVDMPRLAVRITSTDEQTGKVKIAYLVDCNFAGEMVLGFLDVVRAGDLPSSSFEFTSNRLGSFFIYTDDV